MPTVRPWERAFALTRPSPCRPRSASAFCQTVLTTMKTYGLILADNGSNWYFQGTADRRWTYNEVDQLKQIPANQFVAVDESCLMVSANSARRCSRVAPPTNRVATSELLALGRNDRQDDIAWRPDPLNLASLGSLHPCDRRAD